MIAFRTIHKVFKLSILIMGATFLPVQAGGWVTAKTLKNVRVIGSTGAVTFLTNEPVQNPSNCSATDFYGIIPSDSPKTILSILLLARASGAPVNFYIPDGAGGCDSYGRPRVTDVMIGDMY